MVRGPSKIDPAEFKVLLVDDDHLALAELTDAVEIEGWQVVTANSVESAIGILTEDQSIRVVITDVHFVDPNGEPANGIQFVSRAQAMFHDRTLSYLVLSGDPGAVKSALQVGAFEFLAKPVDPEELAFNIRSAFASGGGERKDLIEFRDGTKTVNAPEKTNATSNSGNPHTMSGAL